MQAAVKLQRAWVRVVLVWGDLCLWFTGWPHLWNGEPHGRGPNKAAITYKDGWGALRPRPFVIPYATTYLAATLAGYGVVSLSRAWYERSFATWSPKSFGAAADGVTDDTAALQAAINAARRPRYPFAVFMTRLLNWLLPGDDHGAHTGGWLWGTASRRNMRY